MAALPIIAISIPKLVGVRDWSEIEFIDFLKVRRIASEQRQIIGDCRRRDHRVKCPRARFASTATQGRGDATERARRGRIERKRPEIGLGLLEAQLPDGLFLGVCCYERTYRQFSERDCGDHWFPRQRQHVGDSFEKDDGAGIENTAWDRTCGHHKV
jgi:hypothetical protein